MGLLPDVVGNLTAPELLALWRARFDRERIARHITALQLAWLVQHIPAAVNIGMAGDRHAYARWRFDKLAQSVPGYDKRFDRERAVRRRR